jgi:hypothetical protein
MASCACACCDTWGGGWHYEGKAPSRTSGERFGYPPGSRLCRECYDRACKKESRTRTIRPCSACGDPGGVARINGQVPLRYDGARVGLPGIFCHACATSTDARRRAFFGAGLRAASRPAPELDARAVRLEAWRILNELAARGDEIEDRRIAAIEAGPAARRGESAAEAARRAVIEYRSGWTAEQLGWPLKGKAARTSAEVSP